jgi:protein-tyrosine phosphatase
VIDLHCHILPGIDDGPETLAGSLELARAAVADGIAVVAATPHVRDDWPTTPQSMERLVRELRIALEREAIPLDVRPGGEVALDELPRLGDTVRRYALAGNPRYLLVEMPYRGWPLDIAHKFFDLLARGITPVLAHPERNSDVQEQPERLAPLVEQGALVQLTAASVDGRLGRRARSTSFRLLDLELAHLIASDAHAPSVRTLTLTAAAEAVGGGDLARWLTLDVPAAIANDGAVPTRPALRRRRPWFATPRA